MRTTPLYLPDTSPPPPWQTQHAAPLGTNRLAQADYDGVIVGAGFTGLACAHRLAQLMPDWNILVIDAMRVGEGASGRNSGFLMDVGHWHDQWDPELNRGVQRLSHYGIEQLRTLVQTHSIDCDWFDGGRYHVAVNRRGQRALDRFAKGMKILGQPIEAIDPDDLAERLGTAHYRQAYRCDGGAFVNPSALIRGMAKALPPSVELLEQSPVTQLSPGSPHQVFIDSKPLSARNLVIATNGFMNAWRIRKTRILPMATFASVTEPLEQPPGREAQWGVVPEELMGSTVRLTADRRILIRSGVHLQRSPSLDDQVLTTMKQAHRLSFESRFPQLADVPFSHTWGGILGVAQNSGTIFGSLGEHAWVCGAHNGVGMSLGTAMGEMLAYELLDRPHPLLNDAHRFPEPSWVPPEPFLSMGVKAYTAWLGLLAGDEK